MGVWLNNFNVLIAELYSCQRVSWIISLSSSRGNVDGFCFVSINADVISLEETFRHFQNGLDSLFGFADPDCVINKSQVIDTRWLYIADFLHIILIVG